MPRSASRYGCWIAATALLALLLALALAGTDWLRRHPQHNPWAPLSLNDPTGWATPRKIAALASDPAACFAALDRSGVRYERLPAIGSGQCVAGHRTRFAGWRDAPAPLAPAGVAPSCAVSVGLLLWQRDVVQPAARLHLGRSVRSVEHLGSYNCRNIRGGNSPSEHATGNAIDIAAFVLGDGRRVSLIDHWDAPDGRSAFLRAVRDGACQTFGTVLSPDYNAAHADHLHLDQARRPGGWRACR